MSLNMAEGEWRILIICFYCKKVIGIGYVNRRLYKYPFIYTICEKCRVERGKDFGKKWIGRYEVQQNYMCKLR